MDNLIDQISNVFGFDDNFESIRHKFLEFDNDLINKIPDSKYSAKISLNRAKDHTLERDHWIESIAEGLVGEPVKFWNDNHIDIFSECLLSFKRELMHAELRLFNVGKNNLSTYMYSIESNKGTIIDSNLVDMQKINKNEQGYKHQHFLYL